MPGETGGVALGGLRKILISIPDSLLKEIDTAVSIEKTNRSKFVREAMKVYLREKRKMEIRDRLRKGYEEMAEINMMLSEICFEADNCQQDEYEERLRRWGEEW
jgi:CopG family transcriptional regulator/antitoxin EndoAI